MDTPSYSTSYPLAWPILITIIALIIWFSFQVSQQFGIRNNLNAQFEKQEATMVNSQKMRAQLDAIAAGTKRLAEQGNSNAQLVVQELQKNGININSAAQASSTLD